jgi:hypothetical protein
MSIFIAKIVNGPYDIQDDFRSSTVLSNQELEEAKENVVIGYDILTSEGIIIRNAQFKRDKNFAVLPEIGSTVVVYSEVNNIFLILLVLENFDSNHSPRSKYFKEKMFYPGEIQVEGIGGSFSYYTKDGSIHSSSATGQESVTIQNGEGVYIQGREAELANFIDKTEEKKPPNAISNIISSVKVNNDDSISITTKDMLTKQLLSSIDISPVNGITIKNYVVGIENNNISLDMAGGVKVNNKVGSIEIDKTGNIILKGIDLKLGVTSLIQWLNNHVHLGNLGAPTSIPTVPITIKP